MVVSSKADGGPGTQNLTFYTVTFGDGKAYLLDCPGFDDVNTSDTEILDMIFQEVTRLYDGDKLIKGLLYFHDISQPRIGGLARKVIPFSFNDKEQKINRLLAL